MQVLEKNLLQKRILKPKEDLVPMAAKRDKSHNHPPLNLDHNPLEHAFADGRYKASFHQNDGIEPKDADAQHRKQSSKGIHYHSLDLNPNDWSQNHGA